MAYAQQAAFAQMGVINEDPQILSDDAATGDSFQLVCCARRWNDPDKEPLTMTMALIRCCLYCGCNRRTTFKPLPDDG